MEIKSIIPFVITGILGLTFPIVLGGGHDLIISLQDRQFTLLFLFILIVVKFLFTFACFGSGAPGGIFFPLALLANFVINHI